MGKTNNKARQDSPNEVFICSCLSLSHVYSFWLDHDSGELWWNVTIPNHRNLIKRFWRGLGYIVGKRPRFGDYDGMIIDHDNIDSLIAALERAKAARWLILNPGVEAAGLKLFNQDRSALLTWLASHTVHSRQLRLQTEHHSSTRVMDLDPKQVLEKIAQIECGASS